MEEKILAKLEQIDSKFDKMEKRIIEENAKLKEELRKEFKQENEKLKEELRKEFKQENEKLKEELRKEFKQENEKLKEQIRKEFKQENIKLENRLKECITTQVKEEILHHMFLFEENYGRRITIAFEEIMSRNYKEERQDKDIKNLERETTLNSAFVYNHEERIATLEKTRV